MDFITLISTAFNSLKIHKMRAFLTLLGIIIGVSSVITMMAVGRGAQVAVTARIQGLGARFLSVTPDLEQMGRTFFFGESSDALDLNDTHALNDKIFAPNITEIAPESIFSGSVLSPYTGESTFVRGIGTTSSYLVVRNLEISVGRFISPSDVLNISNVVVLGSETSETLFGGRNPIGTDIRLLGKKFTVVGILESQEGTTFNPDNRLVVPITTSHFRLNNRTGEIDSIPVDAIHFLANNAESVPDAKEQAKMVLRLNHQLAADDENDFTLSTQQDAVETLEGTQSTFVILLGSIASISLLVGGIGVMNIMLVSVTERTREIGIRRAVGARRKDILIQFMTEATIMTFGGGFIGIIAGSVFAIMLNGTSISGDEINTVLEPTIAFLALGVSILIGMFFGIYPAVRASSLSPIQALKYE